MTTEPSRPYTLYIDATEGDCTLTDGLGRFCTFFWGRGAWTLLTPAERRRRVRGWLDAAEGKLGARLEPPDRDAILSTIAPAEA